LAIFSIKVFLFQIQITSPNNTQTTMDLLEHQAILGRLQRKHRKAQEEAAALRAQVAGETQTHVGVGVREGCLRELLDSRCTKRCALQWRSQNCLQARVRNSSSPLNLKSRFCHRELFWFWKWNFLSFF
jgi:hypothetical protein